MKSKKNIKDGSEMDPIKKLLSYGAVVVATAMAIDVASTWQPSIQPQLPPLQLADTTPTNTVAVPIKNEALALAVKNGLFSNLMMSGYGLNLTRFLSAEQPMEDNSTRWILTNSINAPIVFPF